MEYALEEVRKKSKCPTTARKVLILVLMEYALEVSKFFFKANFFQVLILVLMEYALEAISKNDKEYLRVLILVLMEYALEVAFKSNEYGNR